MMIYLYAIVEQRGPLPAGLEGIDHKAPRIVRYENIAAVVGESQMPRAPLCEDKLWLHEKLLEGLMLERAVLPVRYGTQLANEQDLLGLLEANQAAFVSNLKRVRGRVELSVRALWEDVPEVTPCAPVVALQGRDYMRIRLTEERDRRARCQRGQVLVDKIDAALGALADQHTIKLLVTPHMLLTAAYLVARERVGAFHDAIALLAVEEQKLQFLCTGPWPPYNFVDVNVELPIRQIQNTEGI
jgi:hypothetical protein